MAGEALDVITKFWKIQDERDYVALVELFAEDAVLEDPIWGRYEGREAIRGFMEIMNKEMSSRSVHFDADEIAGDDTIAWCKWRAVTPGGDRTGVGIYKVRNGQLTYYRDYMDPKEGEDG